MRYDLRRIAGGNLRHQVQHKAEGSGNAFSACDCVQQEYIFAGVRAHGHQPVVLCDGVAHVPL